MKMFPKLVQRWVHRLGVNMNCVQCDLVSCLVCVLMFTSRITGTVLSLNANALSE